MKNYRPLTILILVLVFSSCNSVGVSTQETSLATQLAPLISLMVVALGAKILHDRAYK